MPATLTGRAERQDPPEGWTDPDGDAPSPSVSEGYERIVIGGLLAFVAFGLVGLVAAIAGAAHPAIVFPAGLVAAGTLLVLWRPDRPTRAEGVDRHRRGARPWVVVAGVAVIAVSTGWNALHAGQHIRTDRDQAIYLNGGKWIAEQGSLVVEGRGPGLDGVPELYTNAFGQQVGTGDTDAELEIQAPHLLHTYLAEATWIGGDRALFVAPALIGAVALAAVFALALRLAPGPLALVALAGLTVNFVWVYAVRDPLAEPLLLLTTFGGALLLDRAASDGRPGRLVAAGVVLGTGLTTRLDAGMGMALVLTVAGVLAVRRAAARRQALAAGGASPGTEASPDTEALPGTGATGTAMVVAVLGGAAIPAVIAVADLALHNTYYLRHHEESFLPVVAFVALGAVAALVLVGVDAWGRTGRGHRRSGPRADRLRVARRQTGAARPVVAGAAAGAVVLVAAAAWFAWPEVSVARTEWPERDRATIEAIQAREGETPDGDRSYAEGAVRRLAWYAGGPAVALGIAGLALVAHRIVMGRARPVELLLVAVAVPATIGYVWRPSIYPDQPWMMRRYLPQVLPGLLLFGALAAEAAGRALARVVRTSPRGRIATAAVAALGACVVVGGALPTTVPLREARAQAGGRAGVERLCTVLGPDATVVMDNQALVGVTLLPAVRSFCEVPAARGWSDTARRLPLEELLAATEEAGRTLWVVAHTAEVMEVVAPTAVDLQEVTLFDTTALVPTIAGPPSELSPQRLTVWVGRVERAT